MKLNPNDVLKVYLGAGENGGYQPLYCEERLRDAFPEEHLRMLTLIAPYLEVDQEPDWSKGDLIEETNRFTSNLRQMFPELDSISIKALGNRWAYGWE